MSNTWRTLLATSQSMNQSIKQSINQTNNHSINEINK